MKKSRFFLIFFCLCFVFIFLTSCNQEKVYVDTTYVKSTMELKYKDKVLTTDNDDYYFEYNIDEEDAPENISFSALHWKSENGQTYSTQDKFTFSCEGIEIFNKTNTSCTIDAKSLKSIGFFIVYAASSVDSSLDTYFVINVIANDVKLAVNYWIDDAYIVEDLDYTDEMLSGTITGITKQLELCAGAIYNFTVYDTSEKQHSIHSLTLDSSKSCVFFRDFTGASGSFVCMKSDGDSSLLTFEVGKQNFSLSVRVTLKDISKAEVILIDANQSSKEFVLSFEANPADDRGKSYLYQVQLFDVLSEKESELTYCLDFENWDDRAENKKLFEKNFIVENNPMPQWYEKTTLMKVADGQTKFICDIDGILKQFKITPLVDTTFTATDMTQHNRHCYLYAKYKSDPNNMYRWKWRIMVGGVLEYLQMNTVTDGKEEIIEKDIEVKEGDETGWIFRAKYIPTTTSNVRTIWYIADNKTEVEYKNASGVTFKAPKPVSCDPGITKGSIKNQVINMMSGSYAQAGLNPFSDVFTNLSGEPFTLYYYWADNARNGVSDLWTNYNSLGEDVIVVAMNLDTFLYASVAIKDLGDKQITIRGITSSGENVPASYRCIASGENIPTNYINEPTARAERERTLGSLRIQAYPYNVVSPYEIYRTFYMPVDSQLSLTLESTFKMNNVAILPEASAKQVFASYEADLSDSGTSAILTLPTKFFSAPRTEKDTVGFKESCLTDEAIVKVSVNGQYDFKLRIVVY